MEHTVKYLLGMMVVAASLSGCADADLTGFIRSTDRVEQRFEQSIAWNNVHPARKITVGTNDYQLLVAGDSHVGGTVNLDRFVDSALADNAAGMIVLGDLSTGHREDLERFRQHLPDTAAMKWIMILGNHDLYFDGWDAYREFFGTSVFTFTIATPQDSDLYICLDSGGGTIGASQLDWLKSQLKNHRAEYRHCIVLTHNNFIRFNRTLSTSILVEELVVMMDLFAEYSVEMVLMGHDHNRSEALFGKTWYVTLDALLDDFANASYVSLEVNGDDVVHRFVSF